MIDFDLIPMLTIVGSLGAAWGGASVALTGAKARIKETSAELVKHIDKDAEVHTTMIDRLARIETKLDALREGTWTKLS